MSFFSSFFAHVDPLGGVRYRNLNLGGFAAPMGQQALVLSQASLAVMLKQMVPFVSAWRIL